MTNYLAELYDAIKAEFEKVDWNEALVYWGDFVKGLESALPVIETLFPASNPVVNAVVIPVLNDANAAVIALNGTLQAYKAGTLSETDVVSAAHTVQSAAVAANAIVGAAMKGNLGVAASVAPVVAANPQ